MLTLLTSFFNSFFPFFLHFHSVGHISHPFVFEFLDGSDFLIDFLDKIVVAQYTVNVIEKAFYVWRYVIGCTDRVQENLCRFNETLMKGARRQKGTAHEGFHPHAQSLLLYYVKLQTSNFKLMFYPFKRAMISWICFFIS